jgi:hypothetical protein
MSRSLRSTLLLPVAACLLIAASAAPAVAADPQGNNGTVKVAGRNVDTTPDNEPHPGCVFNVEFYGFDEGGNLNATASFTVLLGATDGPTFWFPEVWIGQDPASGAGTTDGLDARRNYDLNDELAPFVDASNPNQGVHVRLTVHADGAQNADTKSKVFWAQGCARPEDPES